ncbi:hypothetical protein [Streptomyces chilikensis]|uniref:Flavodoxin-like domain-containing protein n=1 Tax=Streptomyces chilikensis TaxID=1194079 RepID=A0ABV3EIW7_9ACTN
MTAKVLVAYGTTNGSTTRIAESVARALQEADLDAEALMMPVAARLVRAVEGVVDVGFDLEDAGPATPGA